MECWVAHNGRSVATSTIYTVVVTAFVCMLFFVKSEGDHYTVDAWCEKELCPNVGRNAAWRDEREKIRRVACQGHTEAAAAAAVSSSGV